MARIRTIKPDFFRHESLFEAERESGLPLRIAFAGLWTVADREGRFRWRPRALKLDVLPYDGVDFDAILGALHAAGFVIRYRVGGEDFGAIPSWGRHQVINKREAASLLPGPDADESMPAPGFSGTNTGGAHAAHGSRHVHAQALNCGEVEGKGREGNTTKTSAPRIARPVHKSATPDGVDPDAWAKWDAYRKAKSGKAWTDEARRLSAGKLRAFGADALAIVEQSVANGWSGLFPIKPATPALQKGPDGPGALAWVTSERGTLAKGRELGIEPRPGEIMEAFRDRVVKANAEQQRRASPC